MVSSTCRGVVLRPTRERRESTRRVSYHFVETSKTTTTTKTATAKKTHPRPTQNFLSHHLDSSAPTTSATPDSSSVVPEPLLSAPAARAVAEQAARLVSPGGQHRASRGRAAPRPPSAPHALEDRRVLFRLKRHEVLAAPVGRGDADCPAGETREEEEDESCFCWPLC